jgi:hypothetical protein
MPEHPLCFLSRRLCPKEPPERLLSDVFSRHDPSVSDFDNACCLWYCKNGPDGSCKRQKNRRIMPADTR